MKKISIWVIIFVSLLSSCKIMYEKKDNLGNFSNFNGFYTADTVGYRYVYYNDSARFEYIDTNAILSFRDIKSMKKRKGKFGGNDLFIGLTDNGKKIFADYTTNNVGNKVAIIFDDKLLMAPTIQGSITGGEIIITGYDLDNELDRIVENFKRYNKMDSIFKRNTFLICNIRIFYFNVF